MGKRLLLLSLLLFFRYSLWLVVCSSEDEYAPLILSACDVKVQLAIRLYDGHYSLTEAPKINVTEMARYIAWRVTSGRASGNCKLLSSTSSTLMVALSLNPVGKVVGDL